MRSNSPVGVLLRAVVHVDAAEPLTQNVMREI
jgi:hypothetical protein